MTHHNEKRNQRVQEAEYCQSREFAGFTPTFLAQWQSKKWKLFITYEQNIAATKGMYLHAQEDERHLLN